tara:strand:- start:16 stop:891 length:876 start_codon:yes stop_codon:yes gene_type:complete
MAESRGRQNTVLIGQVTKAKSNHRVERSTRLLRSGNFPGSADVVYLGNIATAILAALESPETPEFTQMPGYNEQKWQLTTTSGPLKVTITSDSYWGLGLLTSGYLNIIELDGPKSIIARLIFDLVASSAWSPWRFKHVTSARKYLRKSYPNLTIVGNQEAWQGFVDQCKSDTGEMIAVMDSAITNIEKKIAAAQDGDGWSKSEAEVDIAAAKYDLDIAKEALADHNIPSVERALARIEAVLIEANPDNSINGESSATVIEQSLEYIRLDSDLIVNPSDDESIPLIDLTEAE